MTQPPSSDEPAGDDVAGLEFLTSAASRVVSQAASILEEELAAGIGAVKSVEERFLNVERLRDEDVVRLLQRFRRDAHEVVDILLDVASAAVTSTGGLAQRAIRLRTVPDRPTASAGGSTTAGGVATLTMPGTVHPGGTAETSMSVDNDAPEPVEGFSFTVTDLVGAHGGRIPASSVRLSPATLTLSPHGSARVTVAVDVPQDVARGAYSGLLQATGMAAVRALLIVEVG